MVKKVREDVQSVRNKEFSLILLKVRILRVVGDIKLLLNSFDKYGELGVKLYKTRKI